MNIVILDNHTANPGDLSWDALHAAGQVTVYERTRPEELIGRAAQADALLTNKVVIGSEAMQQLPRLRYVGVLATGYNVVDVEAARKRGITVTNVPAYSTESVAQMVFAHLLTVTNRTEHYAQQNRNGQWSRSTDFCYWDTPIAELSGKLMAIVGMGHIGRRVATIAMAFGMQVLAVSSKPQQELPAGVRKVSTDEAFAQSDVISLHCPLCADTHHLVNHSRLQTMKPTAVLINTGRGPLVDEHAVARALNEGRLAAYCADVMEQEPPAISNPLLQCSNAFITPHIAWATKEARQRLVAIAIDNVKAWASGRAQNVV